MSESCLCDGNIPLPSAVIFTVPPDGRVVHSFHKDCPEHGVTDRRVREMRKTFKRAWLNPFQCRAVLAATTAELIQKHPGGKVALVEWVEWELYPETKEL